MPSYQTHSRFQNPESVARNLWWCLCLNHYRKMWKLITITETVYHFPYPLAENGVHGAQHKPFIRKFLWTLQEFIRLKYLNIAVTWNVIQHETFKVTTKGLKHVLLCYKNVNLHKKHSVTSSATRYVYDFLCTQFLIERLHSTLGEITEPADFCYGTTAMLLHSLLQSQEFEHGVKEIAHSTHIYCRSCKFADRSCSKKTQG